MKKILTVMVAILGFAGMANAQGNATTNTASSAVTTTTASETGGSGDEGSSCYCCPKGDYCSTQAGTCALHVNLNLVKDGDYYCPMEDNITGSAGGSCPVSNKEMKKMDASKCAGGKDMKKKNTEEGKSASSEGPTQTGK